MKRKLFIGLAIGLGIMMAVTAITAYRIVDNVRIMLNNYVEPDNEPYGDVPTLPNRVGPGVPP